MESVSSARAKVLKETRRMPSRHISLEGALCHVLDHPITADMDMPPFDKALVDGYAVRAADLAGGGPWPLTVVDEVDAGMLPKRALQANEAALVMTGAPLPKGADAVVMHEHADFREGNALQLSRPVAPGQNRLERGREFRSGETLIEPGTFLNAAHIGVLAATGHQAVRVVDRPRVNVAATGDELVYHYERPGPGQIRNSNSHTLQAMLASLGYHGERIPILPDKPVVLLNAFRRIIAGELDEDGETTGYIQPDVLLISGGVSAGRRDLVPAALIEAGVRPVFHKVKVKPGKPLWFGVGPERRDETGRPPLLVFGLPGNPVSGIVSVLLFVAPALAAMSGRPAQPARRISLRLTTRFEHRGDRATYHPARLTGTDAVTPLPWAGSADLRTIALADGFAVFAEGDRDYPEGELVEFLPMPSTLAWPSPY